MLIIYLLYIDYVLVYYVVIGVLARQKNLIGRKSNIEPSWDENRWYRIIINLR